MYRCAVIEHIDGVRVPIYSTTAGGKLVLVFSSVESTLAFIAAKGMGDEWRPRLLTAEDAAEWAKAREKEGVTDVVTFGPENSDESNLKLIPLSVFLFQSLMHS